MVPQPVKNALAIYGTQMFIIVSDKFTTFINPLAPNDVYIRRTAQLTTRRCILNIYSTNILTEYFKHAEYSLFFFLQDAVYFTTLPFFGSSNIHTLNTECAKV